MDMPKCPALPHAGCNYVPDDKAFALCAKNNGFLILINKPLIAIDIDDPGWVEPFEEAFPECRQTVCCKTSKGRHYYFMDTEKSAFIKDSIRQIMALPDGHPDLKMFPDAINVVPIDVKTICESGTRSCLAVPPSGGKEWIRHPEFGPTPESRECDILPMPDNLVEYIKANHMKFAGRAIPRSGLPHHHQQQKSVVQVDSSEVDALLGLLSHERLDSYPDWINVGMTVKNIDDSERGLEAWKRVSSTSAKFKEGECENKWTSFRRQTDKSLGIGSLHVWAKQDNPDGYAAFMKTPKAYCIGTGASPSIQGRHWSILRANDLEKDPLFKIAYGLIKQGSAAAFADAAIGDALNAIHSVHYKVTENQGYPAGFRRLSASIRLFPDAVASCPVAQFLGVSSGQEEHWGADEKLWPCIVTSFDVSRGLLYTDFKCPSPACCDAAAAQGSLDVRQYGDSTFISLDVDVETRSSICKALEAVFNSALEHPERIWIRDGIKVTETVNVAQDRIAAALAESGLISDGKHAPGEVFSDMIYYGDADSPQCELYFKESNSIESCFLDANHGIKHGYMLASRQGIVYKCSHPDCVDADRSLDVFSLVENSDQLVENVASILEERNDDLERSKTASLSIVGIRSRQMHKEWLDKKKRDKAAEDFNVVRKALPPMRLYEMSKEWLYDDVMAMKDSSEHSIANVVLPLIKNVIICDGKSCILWDGDQWHVQDNLDYLLAALEYSVLPVLEVIRNHAAEALNQKLERARLGTVRIRAQTVNGQKQQEKQEVRDVKKQIDAQLANLDGMLARLKTEAGIHAIAAKLRRLVKVSNSGSLWDSRVNLIGFNNGVYDLDAREFRKAEPSDYVTMSVNYDYLPEVDPTLRARALKYWSDLHEDPEIREYLIKTFARQLYGDLKGCLFHAHVGSLAGNGKSEFFNMLHHVLGQYYAKVDTAPFVDKQLPDFSRPQPVFARLKGVRIAMFEETDRSQKLNGVLLKMLSSNTDFIVRDMYERISVNSPQFKLHCTSNDPPQWDGDNEGMVRRMRKVDYKTVFVMDVNNCERMDLPAGTRILPADRTIFDELASNPRLKMEFMRIFLDAFDKDYTFPMPQAIELSTRVYRADNISFDLSGDRWTEFRERFIHRTGNPGDYFTTEDAVAMYNDVFRFHNSSERYPAINAAEFGIAVRKSMADLRSSFHERKTIVRRDGKKERVCGVYVGFKLQPDPIDG
jgi:ribosomal protein L29